MSDATIELLKNWEPAKMTWPASATVKYDGVPLLWTRTEGGLVAYTRQGMVNTSLINGPIYHDMWDILNPGEWAVGEVWSKATPFKEISGAVRQKYKTNVPLQLWVFDSNVTGNPQSSWLSRAIAFGERLVLRGGGNRVRAVTRVTVNNGEDCERYLESVREIWPDVEGLVIHSHDKQWSPGKRCWGTQRLKPSPTIDCKVVSFEEAISASEGNGLAMVGRINVEFSGLREGNPEIEMAIIGVGPGSLSHDQRRQIFANPDRYIGRVAEIKYMRDDSYSALRQPTFLRWRDDK